MVNIKKNYEKIIFLLLKCVSLLSLYLFISIITIISENIDKLEYQFLTFFIAIPMLMLLIMGIFGLAINFDNFKKIRNGRGTFL